MVALGVLGRGCYLADNWNRLDFFIVLTGWVGYLNKVNFSLSDLWLQIFIGSQT